MQESGAPNCALVNAQIGQATCAIHSRVNCASIGLVYPVHSHDPQVTVFTGSFSFQANQGSERLGFATRCVTHKGRATVPSHPCWLGGTPIIYACQCQPDNSSNSKVHSKLSTAFHILLGQPFYPFFCARSAYSIPPPAPWIACTSSGQCTDSTSHLCNVRFSGCHVKKLKRGESNFSILFDLILTIIISTHNQCFTNY